jgi:hypothetical protein
VAQIAGRVEMTELVPVEIARRLRSVHQATKLVGIELGESLEIAGRLLDVHELQVYSK